VPSCNTPAALLVQSKRLPLVWDDLGIDVPAWKELLPTTLDPRDIGKNADGWIYKPAMGRVGEGISIKITGREKEQKKIERDARKRPKEWVAQKQFQSKPLVTDEGERYHLCLGVFTVQGKAAGFYGRVSQYPLIDANAIDIPVLVERSAYEQQK
jgi:glutathionylspermidine synthase